MKTTRQYYKRYYQSACLAFILLIHTSLLQAEPVQHIVMLWFPEHTTEQTLTEIIYETRQLASIPGLTDLKVGTAIPSSRSIVDDSFTIGISMQFPDQATMNAYLTHPTHVEFVNQYIKGKTEKIIVYDF